MMLSILELLNPVEPVFNEVEDAQASRRNQAHLNPSNYRFTTDDRGQHSSLDSVLSPGHNHNSSVGMKQHINFPPFEEVKEKLVKEIKKYGIPQFGSIYRNRERIPYSSSKRDFSTKTGRECIEAFKYTFQIPDQTTVYTIMWDYNLGLVRMTPFFKSLGYSKTKPSQALDKNPGLRDVCPSITGGAVLAQGYWMPFYCAKAMCATFCHRIAGALIPIFGPDFPSTCTSPDSLHFGDMVISQRLIDDASRNKTGRIFCVASTGHEIDTSQLRTVSITPTLSMHSVCDGRQQGDATGIRKRPRDVWYSNDKMGSGFVSAPMAIVTNADDSSDLGSGSCIHRSAAERPPSAQQCQYAMGYRHKRRRMMTEASSTDNIRKHANQVSAERRILSPSKAPSEPRRREMKSEVEESECRYTAANALMQIGRNPVVDEE